MLQWEFQKPEIILPALWKRFPNTKVTEKSYALNSLTWVQIAQERPDRWGIIVSSQATEASPACVTIRFTDPKSAVVQSDISILGLSSISLFYPTHGGLTQFPIWAGYANGGLGANVWVVEIFQYSYINTPKLRVKGGRYNPFRCPE